MKENIKEYPNWFKITAESNFFNFLYFFRERKIKALQIGAYTGDASLWLLENILTHPESQLLDIDTWAGSDEKAHQEFDWKDVEEVYDNKIAKYADKVIKIKSTSFDYLNSNRKDKYDFIYIDGDHTALFVFMDALLSWDLLKPGGILIFDDYTWGSELNPNLSPKLAIDKFIDLNKEDIEILNINAQVVIKKRDKS